MLTLWSLTVMKRSFIWFDSTTWCDVSSSEMARPIQQLTADQQRSPSREQIPFTLVARQVGWGQCIFLCTNTDHNAISGSGFHPKVTYSERRHRAFKEPEHIFLAQVSPPLKKSIVSLFCFPPEHGDGIACEKRVIEKACWACVTVMEETYEKSICIGFMSIMRYICQQNTLGEWKNTLILL